MRLLAKPKLELVAKTLMDLAKVVVVAAGLFTTPKLSIKLTAFVITAILFAVGWIVCPANDEPKEAVNA